LGNALKIHIPTFVQVHAKGRSRLMEPEEAMANTLGALGTLTRTSGVKAINVEIDGQPVAVALIEGARFGEDSEGNTLLQGLANEQTEEQQPE
jgi:hypothetical protein